MPLLAACGGGSVTTATGAAKAPVTTAPQATHASGATTTTTAPHFSGDSGSSWCDLVRSLQDSQRFQNIAKDPRAWVDLVSRMLPEVEAKAPGPIKADIHTMVVEIRAFMQVLVADSYDFSKVTAAQLTGLQSPGMTSAADRVTVYDKQVCGTKG